ncbi:RCC1 domain-containing protein [Falsiroseomonas sp.]|uniref:RCC1 domain-containing protein n=1 Tax=Falsiroseomonas sp. TaxID=2870721 RepID=UPI003F7069B1
MLLRRAFFGGIEPDINWYVGGQNSWGETAAGGTGADQYFNAFQLPLAPWNTPQKWTQFALYARHMMALRADGTIWSAGDNSFGQLGQGDTTLRRALTQIGTATHWRKVGVGSEFSAALDRDGNIWTFGRNDIAAQLNDGTAAGTRTAPYNTALTAAPYRSQAIRFIDMWVGHRWVAGLDNQGDLWTWGNNGSMQLGRGSPEENGGITNQGYTQDRYCKKVSPAGPWRYASVGAYNGAGFHEDGQVWMWGLFGSGQRGPGVSSQLPAIVAPNAPGTFWVNIFCGEYSTFLLRNDGTLWACGQNTSGELGIGTTSNTSTLTQVVGTDGGLTITEWRWVHCALNHTLAVAQDGTLWGWGSNQSKKLGRADLAGASYSTPKLISAATAWRSAYAAEYSSIAVRVP